MSLSLTDEASEETLYSYEGQIQDGNPTINIDVSLSQDILNTINLLTSKTITPKVKITCSAVPSSSMPSGEPSDTNAEKKYTHSTSVKVSNLILKITDSSGLIHYWNGSQWVEGELKYWNGTKWVDGAELKYWNGNKWVEVE